MKEKCVIVERPENIHYKHCHTT